MDRNALYRALSEAERRSEKAKTKRMLITIGFFSLVIFAIFLYTEQPEGLEILEALGASIILGGIYFYFNAIIFSTLYTKSEEENRYINTLKKKLAEIDRAYDHDDDYLDY